MPGVLDPVLRRSCSVDDDSQRSVCVDEQTMKFGAQAGN